jgi:hypothetical protein
LLKNPKFQGLNNFSFLHPKMNVTQTVTDKEVCLRAAASLTISRGPPIISYTYLTKNPV